MRHVIRTTALERNSCLKRDGMIQRLTSFAPGPSYLDLVLSGPHFFVGNAFNKTPRREQCTLNSHYDVLDLTELAGDDYLPRTNYVPASDSDRSTNAEDTACLLDPRRAQGERATG